MIVVDTSVWIDVLRGADSPVAIRFEALLDGPVELALTDVVLTEVLQGVRDPAQVEMVHRQLLAFPVLRLDGLDDFARAAELCRTARRAGVTIRKTLDCLIAVPCIRTASPLLHADADFDRLATCTELEIVPVG